nr:Mobile element protein [Klebsiella michiganensis]
MAVITTGLKAVARPAPRWSMLMMQPSKLMELLFVKSESTFSYFEATRRYIDKHGKPLALYQR